MIDFDQFQSTSIGNTENDVWREKRVQLPTSFYRFYTVIVSSYRSELPQRNYLFLPAKELYQTILLISFYFNFTKLSPKALMFVIIIATIYHQNLFIPRE